jgi:4-hydroxy-3-polyprenylbenzoate decarboxylase
MAFKGLHEFISFLEKTGELVRISHQVSTDLEITEIVDRVSKSPGGGKALLFENNGTDFPLLINAFGSEKRMAMALGCRHLDEIGERIELLFKNLTEPKPDFYSKLKALPLLSQVASWMPKSVGRRGACQQIVMKNPDLTKLPVLKCWPADGGPFITLPCVITRDLNNGMRNVGMYRMQVLDAVTTGMHWHQHKTGARHFQEYKRRGERMPVSVVLGGDPAYTYSATAPLPDNLDEYLLAGFLRDKKVELVKCLTNDLEVPSDADFVIEGYVDPGEELVWEGPFGDHTGFYSLADWYPKFHVTCITHRKDAVYPATIVGIPPQEDAWIGKATERIFLQPMKLSMIPELQDMDLPP